MKMLFHCQRALWFLHVLLYFLVSLANASAESTEHTLLGASTVSTGDQEVKSTVGIDGDQMVNDAPRPDVLTAFKTNLIIAKIVERTVDKFLEVIRTQPDWLATLLQLVRDEREIRFKYNCSTDVCIHKIQLFTHLLWRQKRGDHKPETRRTRRSVDSVQHEEDTGEEGVDASVEHSSLSQNDEGQTKSENDEIIDALRLPEPLTLVPQTDRETVPLSQEVVGFQGMLSPKNHAQRNPSITKAFYKQLKRPTEEEEVTGHFLESIQELPPLQVSRPLVQPNLEVTESTVPPTQESTTTVLQDTSSTSSPKREKKDFVQLEVGNGQTVPAFQFGSNAYSRHYENCTGVYENYCYFAVKCLYISLLETVVCYCKAGFTGVRCDEYNLPENFDNLEPHKGDIVNIEKLEFGNAMALYSAVEATAYYTVNAVLEEDLVVWEDPY